jgi:glycosyltransferase involved in cell wall biosynthesis
LILLGEIVRLSYVALSPTFGMNQYAADLANCEGLPTEPGKAALQVCAITNRAAPPDRFGPQVDLQPVVEVQGTGLKPGNFNPVALRKVYQAIIHSKPDVVHFTGPHIWNPILLWLMRRAKIPTIHTIHDLDPHSGSSYGRLLYVWNDSIKRLADHILVHSQAYRARLLAQGLAADRVTYAPLLHLFVSYESEQALQGQSPAVVDHVANQPPFALFFARLEPYKGVDVLLAALRQLEGNSPVRAVIAGKGNIQQYSHGELPGNVEVRTRQIGDQEAIELFSTCSVVVLPYLDATQSALVAAAYFFGKPVIVTRTGALPEYVVNEETGWIIEPRDVQALADRMRWAFTDLPGLARMGHAGRNWYAAQRCIERRTLHLMYGDAGRTRAAFDTPAR